MFFFSFSSVSTNVMASSLLLVRCSVVDLLAGAGQVRRPLQSPPPRCCKTGWSSTSSVSSLSLPTTRFLLPPINPNNRISHRSPAAAAATSVDSSKPDTASAPPCLSDILWPSAGAFAAMAILGKMDEVLARKGLSLTIAPLGAVCAVLFIAPSSPAARKYNVFMAQIFCSAIGVLALTILGPGWLARSTALAASIAFMIYTRSVHPPAASLPILFIDGAKLHHLNYWYMLFPGATGCILLCLIQQLVCYLKENFKF